MSDDRRRTSAEDAGFLERWSRRKAAARDDHAPGEEPHSAEAGPQDPASLDAGEVVDGGLTEEEAASLSATELAERCGLPDPDQLGPDADFTVFMREGVPLRLRNAALRQLWRSAPELACLDGLVDYGENFRTLGYEGVLKTAYEVGSGFKARIEAWEREQQALAEKRAAEAEAQAAQQSDQDPKQDPKQDSEQGSAPAVAQIAVEEPADPAPEDAVGVGADGDNAVQAAASPVLPAPVLPAPVFPESSAFPPDGLNPVSPRRRMRFRFAEDE